MQAPASLQDESLRSTPPSPSAALDPNHFPTRLHEMLSTIDDDDRDGNTSNDANIVSWQPHGRSFTVNQPAEFVDKILPL